MGKFSLFACALCVWLEVLTTEGTIAGQLRSGVESFTAFGALVEEKSLKNTAQYSSQTDHAEDHRECFVAVSKIKSQTCKEDAAWHTDIKNKTTLLIIHGDLL